MAEGERLVSVTIGEWAPLGGTVELRVAPKRTVLVGVNGAGKSLLIDASVSVIDSALAPSPTFRGPARWGATIGASANDELGYEYKWRTTAYPSGGVHPWMDTRAHWSERCWRVASGESVWEVKDGIARFGHARLGNDQEMQLPSGTGLLRLGARHAIPELQRLRSFLSGIHR